MNVYEDLARYHDPERIVRYPLSWPAWLAEKVRAAATARTLSMAAWMREAILEKLEREDGR